jgi:hypothetical protein
MTIEEGKSIREGGRAQANSHPAEIWVMPWVMMVAIGCRQPAMPEKRGGGVYIRQRVRGRESNFSKRSGKDTSKLRE